MASDTGTLDLERVAAERRRLEAEAEAAARDADVEHPAVVAQRIVDEVLKQAELGAKQDEIGIEPRPRDEADAETNPGDPGAIARRIVDEVLRDQGAVDRAVAAAEEVTGSREVDAAAEQVRNEASSTPTTTEGPADEQADEHAEASATDTDRAPLDERLINRVYIVLPGDEGPMVLMPGDGMDPDTRPYIPRLRRDPSDDTEGLAVKGWDGAALVDRALAPLAPHRSAPPTDRDTSTHADTDPRIVEGIPRSGTLTQNVAWIALAGMWLVAMAALVPLMFQSWTQSVDATPPDFWDDSAVVEDGAPAGDELEDTDPEELLDS